MLLCDKCHRLIDRVSPDDYPAATLNAMRASNVGQVAGLFASLRFPSSDMIVIGGNIVNQSVVFNQRLAEGDARREAAASNRAGATFRIQRERHGRRFCGALLGESV